MADPLLEFDPTSEDAANSPLSIWNTASYAVQEFDAPAPPLDVQWAGSVDTEGSLPASRKHQNRQIAVTVDVLSASALRSLQAKIGKVAREGGTLKLTLPNSEVVTFDLHAADTFEPQLDVAYFVNSGAYCRVKFTLLAKSYGRGPEVDLGDNVETTLPALVFTDTGVKGDMPGLGRLVIDNDDGSNAQNLLLWGLQSRYYSNATTAALFYQAESCAMLAAAVATGPAGASGGATNNSAFFNNLGALPGANPLIAVGASSTAQTHIGTFRVFARAWAPAANAGIVSLKLQWQPTLGGSTIDNDYVQLADNLGLALEDQWLLVDLGLVSIPVARAGTQGWIGSIQGGSTVSGDDIYLDWVMLVPVDEGSGELSASIPASGTTHVRHDSVLITYSGGGGYLTAASGYEGDYLRIPPAGAEARTLRVVVKLSRGGGTPGDGITLDAGTDDVSARLFYTPRYLVVPEP